MKKIVLFGLLLGFIGCAKESHEVTCIADFSIIPYHTHTQGPVFTVTVNDQTYLTFVDAQGKKTIFDKHYMCEIN